MSVPRKNPPKYAPNARLLALRANGWTLAAIAERVDVRIREIYRWAAGDSRPIGVYVRALNALPDSPPPRAPR
jgi:hypothetical protein